MLRSTSGASRRGAGTDFFSDVFPQAMVIFVVSQSFGDFCIKGY
jgi:hypothetical protein